MKIRLINSLVFIILLFTTTISFSQDCYYYHEYQCKFPNTTYYISGQSRSALFANGMTSEFKIVTFGGEDYHISVCHQFKTKNVRFRLIEDNEDKTVLFDNAANKYTPEVSFSNNSARRLIIEVSIPEDPSSKDGNQCVGVLIHSRRTYQEPKNKIGF
jgi:hypothetical protein